MIEVRVHPLRRRGAPHVLSALTLALLALGRPDCAQAARDWFDGTTWSDGQVPDATSAKEISGPDPVSLTGAGVVQLLRIGQFGVGELNVAGAAASLTGTNFSVGINGGTGILTLEDNARWTATDIDLGATVGSRGDVTVDASTVNAAAISIAGSGTATFVVRNGGVVRTTSTVMGEWGGGIAALVLSGDGSEWRSTGQVDLGMWSSATVNVSAGAAFETLSGATLGRLHRDASATVNVSGARSTWYSEGTVVLGDLGRAIVTVADGGNLTAPRLVIAQGASANGRLAIGGDLGLAPRAGGTLDVGAIEFGAGTGTLVFNVTGSPVTYAGTIAGAGDVRIAAGSVIFTGDSAAVAGASGDPRTYVDGGSLTLRGGTLRGTVAVANGARLGGDGSVGSTTLAAGSVFAPSGSAPFKVNGDLTFNPNSVFEVSAAPDGSSSRVVVSGAANLAGSVLHVGAAGTYAPYQRYTILQANTLNGTFGSVTSNYAYLTPALAYEGQDVLLELGRKPVPDSGGSRPITFADQARTGNQRAVADALETLPTDNPIHQAVLTLPEGAPPAALAQLAGESHAGAVGALNGLAGAARSVPFSQLRRGLGASALPGAPTASAGTSDAPLSAATLPTSGALPAWAQVVGQWQTSGGNDGIARTRQHTGGFFAGADTAVGGGWRLGGALGVTNSKLSVGSLDSSTDIDSYSATLYGGRRFEAGPGHINVLLGAAYTWHDIASERNVSFAGVNQQLTADYGASSSQLFGEVGYGLPVGEASVIEPYAGLAFNDQRVRGFNEAGGSAALQGKRQHDQTTTTTLGLRGATRWDSLTLSAGAGWRYTLGDVASRSRLAFADSAVFTVAGAPIARNALVTELGMAWRASRALALSLTYDGEYGGSSRQHAATLRANWAF
ncbi:autotransporter family protein [Bordetella genomosp. 1]|uniref:autotransporter family protein n=1 Tax=Bordetella genomosp. 1 TaxID=1395607 RepID=UPI001140DAEA|nr:autotransporter outer membrane beta-barrel domain-containing protein [Bordetella genomosp. 1]